jgi:DNA-binding CsgD family transcriptional regulator
MGYRSESMAKHLIIAFYLISNILGGSFLLLALIGWLKSRRREMKYLLLSVVALTLILLEQMVTAYEIVNFIESKGLYFVFTGVSAIGCGLMIYSLTRLVKLLMKKTLSRKIYLVIISASVLPLLLTLLYFITMERVLIWIAEAILFGFILHNILDMLMNMDRIESEIVKSIIRRVIVFCLMMVPILILDLFIERIPGIKNYFPYGLLSVFLLYTVLSVMGLYYSIKCNAMLFITGPIEVASGAQEEKINAGKVMKHSEGKIDEDYEENAIENTIENAMENNVEKVSGRHAGEMDKVLEKYKITAREKEIILLLINGNTYHDIEVLLSISLPTVKTHVSHIYKKLNIKNKIELVNLCRNHTKV